MIDLEKKLQNLTSSDASHQTSEPVLIKERKKVFPLTFLVKIILIIN